MHMDDFLKGRSFANQPQFGNFNFKKIENIVLSQSLKYVFSHITIERVVHTTFQFSVK